MTNQPTLLFSTLFAVVSAGIYGYVGWRLGKRVISSSEGRLAWGSFTIWWYGLAATTLIGGFQNLFGAFGLTSLALRNRDIYQCFGQLVSHYGGCYIT